MCERKAVFDELRNKLSEISSLHRFLLSIKETIIMRIKLHTNRNLPLTVMIYVDDPMMDCCCCFCFCFNVAYRKRTIEPITLCEDKLKPSSQTHRIARQLICILNSEIINTHRQIISIFINDSIRVSRLHVSNGNENESKRNDGGTRIKQRFTSNSNNNTQ